MFKQATPRQISLYTAFVAAFVGTTITILSSFGASFNHILFWALLNFIVLFISAFVILEYFLKRFIIAKINLIYKTIHKEKVSPKTKKEKKGLSGNALINVEKAVENWMEIREKEIEKYKSLSDYRRRFVGDISHELKTPIFSIQGYLETLADGAIYDKKHNIRFLKKAIKNVDRLNIIIQDLETISNLESGFLEIKWQEFNIKDLVLEVFDELEMSSNKHNIQLKIRSGANKNFKVKGDKSKIRRVITNLLNNSIKYRRNVNGETIVSFYRMDKLVLIEVADNGIGIPKKHINHVFDRFYRVDKGRSREQGGSGLGLSIVKHIIDSHGQSINVRSTEGIGTTFGFTLEESKKSD